MCADCWGAKEPTARPLRVGRTEPLLEIDWNDPFTYVLGGLVVTGIVITIVKVFGWVS